MPKYRHVKRTAHRDLAYEEAFGALPTELLELIYEAREAAGLDPDRLPTPEKWEAMGKQGRLRYLAKRDRELPRLIREQEQRNDAALVAANHR
jgi:hypothetical protein